MKINWVALPVLTMCSLSPFIVSCSKTDDPNVDITKIEISSPPRKTDYKQGEQFLLSGLVVTATNSSGERIVVTNQCSTSINDGYILTTIGTVTIIVTHDISKKTCSFNINVQKEGPITEPTIKDIKLDWGGETKLSTSWTNFNTNKLYPEDLTVEIRCLDETFGNFTYSLVKTSDKTFDINIQSNAVKTIVNQKLYRFKIIIRNLDEVLINSSEYTITPTFVSCHKLDNLNWQMDAEYRNGYTYEEGATANINLYIYDFLTRVNDFGIENTVVTPKQKTDVWRFAGKSFKGLFKPEGLEFLKSYITNEQRVLQPQELSYDVETTITFKYYYSGFVETKTIKQTVTTKRKS